MRSPPCAHSAPADPQTATWTTRPQADGCASLASRSLLKMGWQPWREPLLCGADQSSRLIPALTEQRPAWSRRPPSPTPHGKRSRRTRRACTERRVLRRRSKPYDRRDSHRRAAHVPTRSARGAATADRSWCSQSLGIYDGHGSVVKRYGNLSGDDRRRRGVLADDAGAALPGRGTAMRRRRAKSSDARGSRPLPDAERPSGVGSTALFGWC
jgi:hypothetical protein